MGTSEAVAVTAEVMPEKTMMVRFEPASLVDNIDAVKAWVEREVAPWVGAQIDCEDADQLKAARTVMADLNKVKEPIEAERKRIKRQYELPLKAFEARVKEITAIVDEARDGIKAQVDAADERFRERRRDLLATEYEGCAGPIAGLIPFQAILDTRWLNRSTGEVKACGELQEATVRAVQGYETVRQINGSVNLRDTKIKYAMYPVWILNTTWRGQNYRFAMNGQTGKFVGDLPIDNSIYWRWRLLYGLGFAGVLYAAMWALGIL
mgnify:CR=1 FL=1